MTEFTARKRRLGLHLPVEVVGLSVTDVPFVQQTRTLNISAGGVCFETSRHLLVGTRPALKIQLPRALRRHFGGHPVYRVQAVVCRVERFQGEVQARIGARFVGEILAG